MTVTCLETPCMVHGLGFPSAGWEILGDLGIEAGEGRVWKREGYQWGTMSQSPSSMAAGFL